MRNVARRMTTIRTYNTCNDVRLSKTFVGSTNSELSFRYLSASACALAAKHYDCIQNSMSHVITPSNSFESRFAIGGCLESWLLLEVAAKTCDATSHDSHIQKLQRREAVEDVCLKRRQWVPSQVSVVYFMHISGQAL